MWGLALLFSDEFFYLVHYGDIPKFSVIETIAENPRTEKQTIMLCDEVIIAHWIVGKNDRGHYSMSVRDREFKNDFSWVVQEKAFRYACGR